jgi:ornithine cyclodeaminase/alanine dehydrogenase-like protein (mu-crystallin family)
MQSCDKCELTDREQGMIYLDDDAVEQLLDLAGVTKAVGDAFIAWGSGEAATTQRVRASTPEAMASAMAAVVPPFSGGKVYATKNGKFTFINVLFDTDGQLLCTLGGDTLTAYRTPATCALAIRALAVDGGASVTTAALVGAGRQSLKHLEMLAAELPALTEIRVADLNPENQAAVVASANAAGIPAACAKDAASAVHGAGVIVTITQSRSPLFPASAVAGGALICAVGSTKYDRCEIGADVVASCSAVVCDDVAGSRAECGDLIEAHRAGVFDWEQAIELHAVLAGTVLVANSGRAPVLFETQGVALQDVAAAGLTWQRYNSLDSNTHDRKNIRETTS